MKVTPRDRILLLQLARLRWLSTGQIGRLVFPSSHESAIHRRLRILRKKRYIRSYRPSLMAEAVHTLGPNGRDLLTDGEHSVEIRLERVLPKHLEHCLGINDIRIAIERSAEREGATVTYFRPCWELHAKNWPFQVIPDAVVLIEHGERSARVIFEYDRGFEAPGYMLRTKYARYEEGLDGFPFSLVVTVVESGERLKQLQTYVHRHLPESSKFSFVQRDTLMRSSNISSLFP